MLIFFILIRMAEVESAKRRYFIWLSFRLLPSRLRLTILMKIRKK